MKAAYTSAEAPAGTLFVAMLVLDGPDMLLIEFGQGVSYVSTAEEMGAVFLLVRGAPFLTQDVVAGAAADGGLFGIVAAISDDTTEALRRGQVASFGVTNEAGRRAYRFLVAHTDDDACAEAVLQSFRERTAADLIQRASEVAS